MNTTSERYTAEQLGKLADDYGLSAAEYGFDVRISNALRQAATLEAEVGRYREALENFARNAPTQSLADLARNAIKED